MIGYIEGKIAHIDRGKIVVMTKSGVGYSVAVSNVSLFKKEPGQQIKLYIYTHVREDALELIGFGKLEDLQLFEQLIDVSGVGPKLGLSIIETDSSEVIVKAIQEADIDFFTSVSGIGKKSAQRLIVELQSKVGGEGIDLSESPERKEVVEAIASLGFNKKEARDALKGVDLDAKVEEQIKEGLKNLKK